MKETNNNITLNFVNGTVNISRIRYGLVVCLVEGSLFKSKPEPTTYGHIVGFDRNAVGQIIVKVLFEDRDLPITVSTSKLEIFL